MTKRDEAAVTHIAELEAIIERKDAEIDHLHELLRREKEQVAILRSYMDEYRDG